MSHHSHSGMHHGGETRGDVIHWAPLYDAVCGRFLRRTHPAVVALAALTPGERVLDVGCGAGSLAIALKASVGPAGAVDGIDASPEMIAVARRNASRSGATVNFQEGLMEAIPFPDGTFDVIVSQLAIHHLPDDLRPAAFKEMRRVLKPGGRCLIVDFEPPTSALGRFVAGILLRHMMMDTNVRNYRPLLEGAGFSRIETGRTRHRLLSFIRGHVAK
jgi:ubiquinone/menaquinone biosynthesis C-methylase UbiE